MTLTEQGKTGKLKDGFYYVKLVDEEYGRIITDKYFNSFRGWEYSENWQISEVLAPVPSYEEWQEEQKSLKVLAEAYCKEKEENQQLKDLLHKCKFDLIGRYTDVGWEDWSLINEIDNAIGEKK